MPEGKPAWWYEMVEEERRRLGTPAPCYGRGFDEWAAESAERANAENTPIQTTQQFPDVPVQFRPLE